jgi:hypothetical protein
MFIIKNIYHHNKQSISKMRYTKTIFKTTTKDIKLYLKKIKNIIIIISKKKL